MNVQDLIQAALTAPKTHRVVTKYVDGVVKTYEARNLASAETYATGERRKVGRSLKSRDTGKSVQVISVTIEEI